MKATLYHLKPIQQLQARKLGLIIQPSIRGNYKIDIYTKDNKYITSIGDKRYEDFATYAEKEGFEYADRRRELYMKRHKNDSQVEGSRGWWAAKILWS
jgi:hypothetical protein